MEEELQAPAPKELHDLLDRTYSDVKRSRGFVEKNGLPKTKETQCRSIGAIDPIPFKSPFDYLGLELYEFNSPKEEHD